MQENYVPIFNYGQERILIFDPGVMAPSQEEAAIKAVVYCSLYSILNFNFSGETILLTPDIKCFETVFNLPDGTDQLPIGIIGGPTFEALSKKELVLDTLVLSQEHISNNIFLIRYLTTMNDKQLGILTGNDVNNKPYVLLVFNNEEYALTPNQSKSIAQDLYRAALFSESDSFLTKAINETFQELEEKQKVLFLENYRRAREEYIASLDNEEIDAIEAGPEEVLSQETAQLQQALEHEPTVSEEVQ